MDGLKNKANNFFMAVATPFIGVLKDSKFLEKGVLTPEEFVLAGDQLTYKCPTWRYDLSTSNVISWEGGLDKLKNKNLPENKQFLVSIQLVSYHEQITRNVPCSKRIKDLQSQ